MIHWSMHWAALLALLYPWKILSYPNTSEMTLIHFRDLSTKVRRAMMAQSTRWLLSGSLAVVFLDRNAEPAA